MTFEACLVSDNGDVVGKKQRKKHFHKINRPVSKRKRLQYLDICLSELEPAPINLI